MKTLKQIINTDINYRTGRVMKMVKNMGRTADGNEVRQIIIKQMLDKVEHAQS